MAIIGKTQPQLPLLPHVLRGEEGHQLDPQQVRLVQDHPLFPLEAVAHLLAMEHGAELV